MMKSVQNLSVIQRGRETAMPVGCHLHRPSLGSVQNQRPLCPHRQLAWGSALPRTRRRRVAHSRQSRRRAAHASIRHIAPSSVL